MIKNFEKCREAVVLNFLNLVLKKYGKWFLKMRGNPGFLTWGAFINLKGGASQWQHGKF